jgi:hypothetical protein
MSVAKRSEVFHIAPEGLYVGSQEVRGFFIAPEGLYVGSQEVRGFSIAPEGLYVGSQEVRGFSHCPGGAPIDATTANVILGLFLGLTQNGRGCSAERCAAFVR